MKWLIWKCPKCGNRWMNMGEGVPGYRFSKCQYAACGTPVSEQEDAENPNPPVA